MKFRTAATDTGSGGDLAVGGAEAEFDGSDGSSVAGNDDDFVADVGVAGALEAVGFTVVVDVGEQGPVMDDEGDGVFALGESVSDGVLGGFEEGVGGGVRIVEEAAQDPRGGERSGAAGQGQQAVDGRVNSVGVFAHELFEAVSVPLIQTLEEVAMRFQIAESIRYVHTSPLRLNEGRWKEAASPPRSGQA